jgi:hypothetical protein
MTVEPGEFAMDEGLFMPRQTNTGLYLQMHRRGFTAEDLVRVQAAYRWVCRMFQGRVRKTERLFVCHAVGAASATAEFSDDIELVLGAMLHAAYDSGQFPDGRLGGDSPAHRRWLAARLGRGVEKLAFRYNTFPFGRGDPERLLRQGCEPGDRDLLFIALAHELDDLMDLGLRFAAKYGSDPAPRIEACAELAMGLNEPGLAAALRGYHSQYRQSDWTSPLASQTLHGYTVVPGLMAYLRRRAAHLLGRWVEVH